MSLYWRTSSGILLQETSVLHTSTASCGKKQVNVFNRAMFFLLRPPRRGSGTGLEVFCRVKMFKGAFLELYRTFVIFLRLKMGLPLGTELEDFTLV